MAATRLETELYRRGGAATIELRGELDGFGEEALNGAFAEALEGNPEAVLLDFGQVAYINSTGIALIVGLVSRCRRAGLPLLICGLNEHFHEIFKITRLSDYVQLLPDAECALRHALAESD